DEVQRRLAGRPEEVVLELRQLPGAGHRLASDEVRRQDLAVSAREVHVEEEARDRALEPRRGALVDGEARPRQLRGLRPLEYAERLADVPVGLRLELEARRLAPARDLDVPLRVHAVGDA